MERKEQQILENLTEEEKIDNPVHRKMWENLYKKIDSKIKDLESQLSSLKYNELEIIEQILVHILDTYKTHYVLDGGKQALDIFSEISDDLVSSYCLTNSLKYLLRYGKKEGKNIKDLLKAIHCIILMIHFDHYKKTFKKEEDE